MLKSKWAVIEGWVSIVGNILLFGIKYWAGIVSGSVAILADAWHTLSDSISSLVVIIGASYSRKPADKEHPFGHGRADVISSMVVGGLLFYISTEFVVEAYHSFTSDDRAIFGKLAIIVTIVSIVLKEILAQFAFWVARRTKSDLIKADAWHHRSDALSSFVILVGIFLGRYFWWIDGVLAIIVAILIAYSAYEIVKESINSLLGKSPDPDLINKIKLICNSHSTYDLQAHQFSVHEYGQYTELTFHIIFYEDTTVKIAHDISKKIENDIIKQLGITATIHFDYKE
ncbi:MAG: cation diffusion facilitator family transporter [Marinifilaceae bacterium]|jgi:cation diffusion facilitator family transporter|nr:cation diffusion facilitator family transporter [Marinifilaceae bacterium]